jgi:ABC-type sugar transport system substrate-binding protein
LSEKKVGRRSALKYGAAVVVAAAVGAAGYGAYEASKPLPPTPTATATMTETMTATATATVATKQGYLWGFSPWEEEDTWQYALERATTYYANYIGDKDLVLDPHSQPDNQIRDIRYMVAQKIDGLMMCPVASMDTLNPVLDWAHNPPNSLPIMAFDGWANTASIGVSVRVDSYLVGQQTGQKFIDIIKADGVAPSTDKVFLVQDRPSNVVQGARKDGLRDALKAVWPNLKFIEYLGYSDIGKTKDAIFAACKGEGRPLAVLTSCGPETVGAVQGLQSAGMAVPHGEKNHVYVGGVDAPPEAMPLLKQQLVDAAGDQPNLFYGPICIKLLRIAKEQGYKALPSESNKTAISDPSKPEGVQSDGTFNIVIEDKEFGGVRPFQYPFWAPAPIASEYGHSWIKCNGYMVTPDNADTAPVWANVAKQWFGPS